jgi:hypothetical protein
MIKICYWHLYPPSAHIFRTKSGTGKSYIGMPEIERCNKFKARMQRNFCDLSGILFIDKIRQLYINNIGRYRVVGTEALNMIRDLWVILR